jgi:hypothetical protein
MFKRVWNDEDEIFILEVLFEYVENKGRNLVSATADMTQFYNVFKQSFLHNTTRLQLADKVQMLKKSSRIISLKRVRKNRTKTLHFRSLTRLSYFTYLRRYEILFVMIAMKPYMQQTMWLGCIFHLIICILMDWNI